MNTLTNRNAYVEMDGAIENVIALDGLEFNFPKCQLEEITNLHNEGLNYKQISKEVSRNEYEVIIALLHQIRQGRGLRRWGVDTSCNNT